MMAEFDDIEEQLDQAKTSLKEMGG